MGEGGEGMWSEFGNLGEGSGGRDFPGDTDMV